MKNPGGRVFEICGIHLSRVMSRTSGDSMVYVIDAEDGIWLRAGIHFTQRLTTAEARVLAANLVRAADKYEEVEGDGDRGDQDREADSDSTAIRPIGGTKRFQTEA